MDALPQWCIPLPDAQRMRAIDRWAIDQRGTPSLDLMERAGAAVAAATERVCPDGPIAILCGKGNNGGDGLVAARLLRDAGRDVDVLMPVDPSELSGDAAENLARLQGDAPIRLHGDPSTEASAALAKAKTIVDALLGTGFRGPPEGELAQAIEAIKAADAPVVSVDVPSGVDASSGAVTGVAVSAAATVSFHAGKPGLWVSPGKQHAGAVEVPDIGIPRGAPQEADVGLITAAVLEQLPRRSASSTKFTSGRVIVVGGSAGLTGAPRMSSAAAMRAGAGYVTVCLPASLQPILAGDARPEIMSRGMPERDGGFARSAVRQVLELGDEAGALALGPGLGRTAEAVDFARELARDAKAPLVLDADGLNAHAGRLADLAKRRAPTVLTPHAGELGRLLEIGSAEVEDERLACARRAAQLSGATVLLKGDDTLIADPGGLVAVSPGGSPALATAGTGDVLTGVIAALIAQGLPAFTAAAAGTWLAAAAARIAAEDQGCAEAVIASDVIAALGRARAGGGA
ncbi:MAG TPA: NAD(P)H-hydrate dehydratase [Solirubrobacteraceae bacterium]|jgi:NAD(P)H-hydrate epimerase